MLKIVLLPYNAELAAPILYEAALINKTEEPIDLLSF